jgi:hypothetical protein
MPLGYPQIISFLSPVFLESFAGEGTREPAATAELRAVKAIGGAAGGSNEGEGSRAIFPPQVAAAVSVIL